MNVYELTLAVLTLQVKDRYRQDEKYEGCRDEFVRCLDRHLPVNYGWGGSSSSYDVIFSYFVQNMYYILNVILISVPWVIICVRLDPSTQISSYFVQKSYCLILSKLSHLLLLYSDRSYLFTSKDQVDFILWNLVPKVTLRNKSPNHRHKNNFYRYLCAWMSVLMIPSYLIWFFDWGWWIVE
jgi:hypothetical protein